MARGETTKRHDNIVTVPDIPDQARNWRPRTWLRAEEESLKRNKIGDSASTGVLKMSGPFRRIQHSYGRPLAVRVLDGKTKRELI